MSHAVSSMEAFHLVGDRSRLHPEEAGSQELVPALFSSYQDLTRLRYDYPVVLLDPFTSGTWVRSLTDIMDQLLQKIAAPGAAGEELRQQVLAMEHSMRELLANGYKGALSDLWEAAQQQMVNPDDPSDSDQLSDSLSSNLLLARAALEIDGQVIDCAYDLAIRMVSHAWTVSEEQKAERLKDRIVRLTQKLKDILEADYMSSGQARDAGKLESTMGSANQSVFDFAAMARVLKTAPAAKPMPKARRDRIQDAISVLQSQQFIALPGDSPASDHEAFRFNFSDPGEAVAAYRERLPQMAALVRAISIAQLEIENRYEESRHDAFFGSLDENRLGPSDVALFSSYLLSVEELDQESLYSVLEILRTGLPFKIVTQTSDILENDSIDGTRLSFGTRGQHLARMATGLDQIFVMQATSAALYRLRDSVFQGLACNLPALFSIFAGQRARLEEASDHLANPGDRSQYLRTAAATESRLFPSFIYNAAAGSRQADRFDLSDNPQAACDWPAHELNFEDCDRERQAESSGFTAIDYVASDPAFAHRFACVPYEDWDQDMVPIHHFLEQGSKQRAHKVPYVLLADQEGKLHRAIFDSHLIDAADRCIHAWHSLQELGGIHNSYAEQALSEAEQEWSAEKEILLARTAAPEAPVTAQATPPAVDGSPAPTKPASALEQDAVQPSEDPKPSSDEPWIETIRCTTCNECTQLNDRMFSYNEDQRAYVADPDAGTFRELVEAAETCQVAIIHPGKPRNPDEPGLEELLVRAEPFNS